MTRVGYLGPPGTFGEEATILFGEGHERLPFPSHTAVIQAVRDGLVDLGVAAIENSLDGAVNETIDNLLAAGGLSISAELVLSIDQNLIAAPGTRFEDIEVVMSHPSALGQCRDYLEQHLPKAHLQAALSTAGAVEQAVQTPGAAAIGTRRAAEISGGELLAEAVQDVLQNKTRFVIIGPADAAPTGSDKTSIAFAVAHDRPGTLIGALKELSDRNINLVHIQSRPSREQLGIYVFLIDFDGHREDRAAGEALAAIKAQSNFFRILGSYPKFNDGA